MTSVEKRRSSRKSGKHRKHSDGGFSDASSGGSFLDENDREVSSLTDRAFRSLCIGDEAVYNDSDLSLSSPSTQRDRQLAFSQSGRDIGTEAREVEELKRTAHENFDLRMQQFGEAWIHGGMYGAEVQSDQQWGGYGQRTQGRVSATFQHSFVETSHLGKSLNEEELSSFSNGATELSSQRRRSRSRVSSLIRAFNSEGHRDGAGMSDNEPSWDKSALMSIQRELSEFSTSYQQNFDSGHYASASPFSSRETNFYSSEVASMAHMSHNSVSSFMRSSHSTHGMSAQVNCNSNFFIHSEFSPFKVWRDHNRFPFQQGEVSGFMHASEFPKWYETPMYKELSLDNQPQGPYRGIRHHRNSLAPMGLPVPSYNTAASSVWHKASAVEKRCESELASNYPHRRRTQSLGTNKLPSQRPSTASPTIEMSRRVRDTISSVKALQQKIQIMTQQNITTGVLADQHGVLNRNDHLIHSGHSVPTLQPDVVSSNTSTTPSNVSQMLRPSVHAHQEADTSGFQQYEFPPQPVEHPPVRAESRGATPEVRMSTYKSRATSLLFNLKDNRKRVKSTYSPTKFKGLDTQQKNKQPFDQEQRETVIDVPEALDSDMQSFQLEESTRTNAAVNQYHSPGLTLTTQPTKENTGQYPGNTSADYHTAQMQGQMVRHAGFSGFIPENYTSNQLTNGQNPDEYLASFTPYGQGGMHHIGTSEGLKQSYTDMDMDTSRLNTDNNQNRQHLISTANSGQAFNETAERMLTRGERYDQMKSRRYDYNNVTSKDEMRHTNNTDAEKLNLKAAISPQKQETALERQENPQGRIKDLEKVELKDSFGFVISSHKNDGLVSTNISKKLQEQRGQLENERKDSRFTQGYHRFTDQEYNNEHKLDPKVNKPTMMQKTGQMKIGTPLLEGEEKQTIQQVPNLQFENNNLKKSSPDSSNASDPAKTNLMKDRPFFDVRGEQVMAERRTEKHTQAELAKVQQRAQVQQPTAESAGLILVQQTGSEKVKAEEFKPEPMKPESVMQTKEEHIKDEKKLEQAKQSRRQQPELTREEQTEAKQTQVQKLTDEPKNVTQKSSNKHMREKQGKEVKSEQAEKEKPQEQQRKTELTNTEQTGPAKSQQAETEKTTGATTEQLKEEQLSSKLAEREHMEAEQIKTEKVHAKPTGTEHRKAEQTEQIKEPRSKTKQMKTKEAEVGEVKADNIRVEDTRQTRNNKDSVNLERINAEKPPKPILTAKDTKLEERKTTQTKLEETKLNQTKTELQKTENPLERSAELASKLAAPQHARSEPDRVKQVKTELAKAKAELAKIKEKMRGEQKEKLSSVILKEGVPLNITKNQDNKNQDKVLQMQTDRGPDDYNSLREKYGFIHSISPIRNKGSTTESVPSKDTDETKGLSLDKVDAGDKDKLQGGRSPTSTFMSANMENKGELALKHDEVKENQYVDDESKKLKLSGAYSFPTHEHKRANVDIVSDNLKSNNFENLGKCGSVKETILQQRDSDLSKLRLPERKPKTVEHSVGPSKDLHGTPPRALSHKDKAQTKQEILTSKIKAHAEKEISAIKEKGFALQLPSSHIRQRPSAREVSKRHDSTETSIMSAKHVMDSSEVQIEPAKYVLPLNSATTPVTSATATSQLAAHVEKPRQTNQTASSVATAPVGLGQKQLGVWSPVSNKEQAPEIAQGKRLVNHDAKHKEELCDKQAINTEMINKRSEGSKQATSVNTANPNPLSTKNAESKETACVDSTSLNIALGPTEASVADDNLQIMGIMVTVRDGKPPVDSGLETNSIEQKKNEKENNKCELDKRQPSSDMEENTPSDEVNLVKANDVQKTLSKLKDNHSDNIHSEIVQETSTLEARESNMTGNAMVTRTNLQQESSTTNAKPQRGMQLEQVTDKSVPFAATGSAKDKVMVETQAIVYQQYETTEELKDNTNKTLKENLAESPGQMMTEDEKDKQQKETTQTNESLILSVVDNQGSSNDAETVSQKLTVKEHTTTVLKDSKSSNVNGHNPSEMEGNSHDSSSSKAFTKTRTSNNSAENEMRHVTQKLQCDETQMTDNSQEDDVHIDSIAIRVVQAVTEKDIVEDNVKIVGNDHTLAISSDVEPANRKQQTSSSSCEKQVNNPNNEHCSKDFTPASSEQERKESLEEKLAVQQVVPSVGKLSDTMKISNKLSCTIAANENSEVQNGKPESNTQPVEEDYFQVQGLTETSNDPHNLTVGDTSEEREHPGLQPNKTAISKEPQEEGKGAAFLFSMDPGEWKADDLTSGSKNRNRNKIETEDIKASEQTYGSMERWSNNEKNKADQANHIRKQHHRESQSSLSAVDKHSSGNSPPTNQNTAAEKLEVKPKEKVATIPEISALADYARLKVIVPEDEEGNTIQEFPPNKKEGFFPLIQSRHSRRPVFTDDLQDLSVEEKSFSKKTEMKSKVNKEPKSLVFPIKEREHQRTGMFKLGDKDTQEKMHIDSKMITGIVEPAVDLKETEKSPTAHTQHMTGAGCQRVNQSPGDLNNLPLQSTTSLFAANMPKNNSEEFTYLDRNLPPDPNLEQMNHRKDNMSDNRSEKQVKDTGAKAEDGGTDQLKILATQHEEPKIERQDRRRQLVEERVSRSEKAKREEEMRLKQIIEKSRASLAEEQRRVNQREEAKRARDREAVAIMIKERQKKQRKAEGRAEEERDGKEKDEEGTALKEKEIKAKQMQEEMRIVEKGEKRIQPQEEQKRKATHDDQQERAVWGQQKRAVQNKQKKSEDEQQRFAQEERWQIVTQEQAWEEDQRRATDGQKRRPAQEKQRHEAAEQQQLNAVQEEQNRGAEEEQQRDASLLEQQRRAKEEKQRIAAENEQRLATDEQKRRAALEEQQRRAADEQKRRAALEEQQRRAAEEQQKRAALEEQQRRAAEEQQKRAALEEQQRKAALEEQQRRAAEEQQRRVTEEAQKKAALEEQQKRAALEEQKKRAALEEQKKRVALEEQQKKAALEEQQKKAALEEQQKRVALEEQQKRHALDEQKRAALEEQQRKAALEEQQRKAALEEQQRKAALEEQQKKAALEEQHKKAALEEQQKKAALEEQQRKAALEEQQRKAVLEEQQKRVALEEQQKRAALEDQQKRAALEEQQKKAALEDQQKRAALEEQQKKAALEEQQKKAALEEQQRKAALEEQQKRVALEEQQKKKAALEEQKKKAALEEQQRKAALEEQKKKAALEEQQKRVALEEQQRRVAEEAQWKAVLKEQQRRAVLQEQKRKEIEELQSRAVQDEKERRAAEEERQRRLAEEEKHWRAAQGHLKREPGEQQRTATQEEHQRRAIQKDQQWRAADEQQRRGAEEEQQKTVALTEEQRQAKKMKEKILEENKRKEREVKGNCTPEERIVVLQEQMKVQQQIEKQRIEMGEFIRVQKHEVDELKRAAKKEKIMKESEEQQAKNESARSLEEKRVAEELLVERESLIQTKPREEDINLVTQREKAKAAQMEKQRRAAQKMDALQYYAITSSSTERKSTERQQSSPLPSQHRNNPLRLESADESIYNSRHYRPHAPASPAPSLPRSNTSSPALGAKPLMFRVKDNTIRGSFFTKSVKPRFHRSFGDISPLDRASDRGEDEQEIMRHSAGTPVHPDMGLNRLAAINESSAPPSTSLLKDYSISHHRPYSRRSIVLDEDDCRSVISNMSEDVESVATSMADLADIRGLLDCDRPDSACSFSSDVSRSMGKPPTVPPKSEKALRRAQRLTSRRMKKDQSKATAGTPVRVEKEVSTIPSSSTEVCSSNYHAVASPHFSLPVSLAHAPALESSLPPSSSEHQSIHHSSRASPHATGPISLPFSSPHATSTLPALSPHASAPASQPAAPKIVAHVPSSPTLHHANQPTPVTQYHVESSRFPQSFPLTQRKVLQDLGSGQYFVVDVPVQVKTKTFFDPETGKYVQLNVRESGQNISQPQPQPKTQNKPQQQLIPQSPIAGKPIVFYHGYHSYPQSYPPAAINSMDPNRSSAPGTLHNDQQPSRESHSYRTSSVEGEHNSQGHCYSPEKTPYMDTVNDTDKSYNPVSSTQNSCESLSECETNSQLTGSSVCENDNLACSLYQPRDIITISELEDFMEVSDW
ncbi:golgin subfamily B member 1 [Cololabis saira]|uniref:golgin subfamily B member 1 n=1 Tax=Cololabis saira TaxID=129043 RepID=UPI002AD4B154|nr:golgin subfamily B member 1 [Cololabis saira]